MSSTSTGIEWTDKTWNPTTGCTKVSPGCLNCYAEALTQRFPQNFPNGFALTQHPERLQEPLRWRTPSRIFVNSMSDLFHEKVPIEFIQQVFSVIRSTPQHVYQILTKRPERFPELTSNLKFPANVWLGVSVESQRYVDRLDYLRQVPVSVRFISCEPLLGPLKLDLTDIHWVIVGGESGQKYRPMNLSWAAEIRDQCQAAEAEVAFFFKQVGGRTPKAGGRLLDNQIWDQMPQSWHQHIQHWGTTPLSKARRLEQLILTA